MVKPLAKHSAPNHPARCFFLLIVFLLSAPNAFAQILRIHFMDVGYGDAILIEFPGNHAMLIDAGGRETSARTIAYVRGRGITRVDTAVMTHPHQNHFEGFFDVLAQFPVGRLYFNGESRGEEGVEKILEEFKRRNVPINAVKRGERLGDIVAPAEMVVLNPHDLTGSPNADSMALWLRFGQQAFLFLADIEDKQFREIIEQFPFVKEADVVQIPHHGGLASETSETLRENFRKKIFVISTGPNKWGIPAEEDLGQLEGHVLRTDRDGTIIIETDGRRLSGKDGESLAF
ncbi:MAG: MBL fold metallo-hydrolase [Candidatus Omnitrophota bacterium]|nr:MBL fold metallo-hydrolase [Candidatus Omnitrophota bacterium]